MGHQLTYHNQEKCQGKGRFIEKDGEEGGQKSFQAEIIRQLVPLQYTARTIRRAITDLAENKDIFQVKSKGASTLYSVNKPKIAQKLIEE